MKTNNKEEKLYIQVFREIRAYIIRSGLKPGDLLPTELEMSQRLGVSRNVLREAIKSMELMGMVKACPGRGTELREFNLDFVLEHILFLNAAGRDKPMREVSGIRRMLELSYMRQAFYTITESDIRMLHDCLHRMRESCENDDLEFAAADRAFHATLFRGLDNGVFHSLMDAIWAVNAGFDWEKKPPYPAASLANHESIVKALEEYDYRAFACAMEVHFSSDPSLNPDSLQKRNA